MYLDKETKTLRAEGFPQEKMPDLWEGYYDDRTDVKWSHPDLTAPFSVPTDSTVRMMEAGIPLEERLRRKKENFQAAIDGPYLPNDVVRTTYTIKGLNEGDPDINVYVVKRADSKRRKSPVLFGIGQGAMSANDYKVFAANFELVVMNEDVTLIFAEARTGAEAPYPAALDDYQATYQWMLDNEKELGINADKVVVMGESGGGYTSLCFAFRCKRVGFKPRGFQVREPITDIGMNYPSSRIIQGGWDTANNHNVFQVIFGANNVGSPFLPPEVVPNHATVEDCKGLSPIFIHAMELDADRDGTMDFARKLYEAKVYTQIHVWGGAAHGAFFAPAAEPSPIHKAYENICATELHDMFRYDFRRPWLSE